MTISATATVAPPSASGPITIGTGASDDAADSNGFAEQFQGFHTASPIAVPLTPVVPVSSIKVTTDGEQPPVAAEPTDNTTGAAMLAALLFGVPGAAPTALPMEFHLTGDSLPPVETAAGPGTPGANQQLLSGVSDAQAISTPLEVATTQVQQAAPALQAGFPQVAALREGFSPQAAAPGNAASAATDLAFAARLKPGPATPANLTGSSPSAEATPRISAIAELRRAELDNGWNQNTDLPPARQMANPATPTFITSDGPGPLATADKPPTPTTSETRAVAPDAPVKSTGPVKDLTLQVGSQNQERVEVRMVERGGELHVAVRTGNTDLAHGLREGISDLVSRLEETGFRTQTWRPVHGTASVSAGPGPQQSATEFRDTRDSQSHPGWSQQQPRDQRDQHQSNRPSWVEELEGSLTPTGDPIPGDKDGLFR